MENQVIIKRYQNRKLYDTNQSCYVTLAEISEQVINGQDILVIDNKTKTDITNATLLTAIYEQERRLPLNHGELKNRLINLGAE